MAPSPTPYIPSTISFRSRFPSFPHPRLPIPPGHSFAPPVSISNSPPHFYKRPLLILSSAQNSTPPGASAQQSIGTVMKLELLVGESNTLGIHQSDKHDIAKLVETIRGMFRSMDMGEVSVSSYDTAWVSLVPSLDDPTRPQFPKSLDWIIDNQLLDGSWGTQDIFITYDRVCSTLACVIALETWNIGHNAVQKGVDFINDHLSRIEIETNDHMTIGFEVVFPMLLEDAKELGLDLPYESSIIAKIKEERNKKLERIPVELLYSRPTTLLHSLEGLHKIVDWKRLLKLQTKSGSLLNSPASTACALKYTRDEKCLSYLNALLTKFNNAVPTIYPSDLFERLWIVDRLERLGIDRYFKHEIKDCLDYVYKYWKDDGIAWSSDANVNDVDDTAMAFRLLRLHGYDVSPEVFKHFEKDGKFFCFEGQTSEAVSAMYNLYRASQVMRTNETILEDINVFTKSFLRERQNKNEIADKWLFTKSLKGEVEYALKHPWSESLPRIETRYYIDQYGANDAWIGKTLYRMFFVNNETFLNLAKVDYNFCQVCHRRELTEILRWNEQCCFDKLPFSREKVLECFFAVSATLFEPEHSLARIVWTMCSVLTTIIDDFFDVQVVTLKEIAIFSNAVKRWDAQLAKGLSEDGKIVFFGLYNTVNDISQHGYLIQGRDISFHLRNLWQRWISSLFVEAKWKETSYLPSLEEYMENAKVTMALEPIVQSTIFFLGEQFSKDQFLHADNMKIMDLVNVIGRINNDLHEIEGNMSCVKLYLHQNPKLEKGDAIKHFRSVIGLNMKLLVGEYIRKSRLSRQQKLVYLYMAKILNSFYKTCDGFTSKSYMKKYVNDVLFSPI